MSRNALRLAAWSLLAGTLGACEKSGKGDVVSLQSPLTVNQQALDEQIARARAQQQEFAAQGRAHLASLDRKIDELKARAGESSDEARQAANDALARLNVERGSASAALERAQNASAESWETVKDSAKTALDRAEQAYDETLQKLKRD